jgi:RNA polymerase sigma-70 factor (ECF subfamily)
VETIRDLLAGRRYSEAFEGLVRSYGDKVYRLCVAMLGDEARAEDAAQDALLRVWRGLEGFRGESSLGTWIYAVTRNTCLNAIEATRTRRLVSLDHAMDLSTKPVMSDSDADVVALVDALPEKYGQVVRLFYLEERSYQEVAQMLDLPVGTVKTYLHRARKELAESLSGDRMTKGGSRGLPGV